MNFRRPIFAAKTYLLAAGIAAVFAGGCVASNAQADISFQNNDNIFPGDPSERVTVGDINGDGLADLILTGSNGSGFTVRIQQQDGSYSSGGYYLQSEPITSVVVFDFNGDGENDLAATKYGGTTGDTKNSIVIFVRSPRFRNRMMQFTTISLEDKLGVVDVVAGDFNGDGKPDLATANLLGANTALILNSGGGSFETPQYIAAGSAPWRARIVNLDGDNADDLLFYAERSKGLFVIRGAMSGKFYGSVNVLPSSSFKAFAVGDLDQNGEQDLVTSDGVSLTVYHGQGWGDFRFHQNIDIEGTIAQIEIADMNNDERQDLVVIQSYPHKLTVIKNLPGDNSFSRSVDSYLPEIPVIDRSAIADLNNDQKLDAAIILRNTGNFTLLKNVGRSTGLKADQSQLFFSDQFLHSQSFAQTITFHNDDDMAVKVEDVELGGGTEDLSFQIDSVYCNDRNVGKKIERIFPHQSCKVNISFKPQRIGDQRAVFSMKTDVTDSLGYRVIYQIPLAGKGISSREDGELDFGKKQVLPVNADGAGPVQTSQWKLVFFRSKLKWRLKSEKGLQVFYSANQPGELKVDIQRCKTGNKLLRKCSKVRSTFLSAKTGKNVIKLSKRQLKTLGKGVYLLTLSSSDKASRTTLELKITE